MIQHHRLLQRQLKKLGLQHTGQTPTPEQWTGLLERVSHAYDEADQERYLHERSAEISSREIQAELEIRTAAVRALRDALKGLFPESSLGPFAASDTDLGAVSRLVADLVREREASRRELDNRIFALDQHANVSIADADGIITYVNERFVDISGYSAAELVGANHRITSSGLHPPEFYREMWQTIAAGRVWHGEIVNRHKNGSLYWVATTIVPWLDPQGRPYQYIAIRTDITRQKEVEAEYRKLALIAARTDNAVVLTDAAGLVVWVNEGFTRLTGYALDEVLGRTPGVVLQGPGTDAGTVRRMAEQLRKGEAFSEEVLNYTKDGRPYWVALEVQPIRDDHGEVVNFMAIESDITERRATRQRLALQFEVSSVLAASDDLTPALGRVLRVICEGLGWQVGQVWGVADEGLRLVETWHAASVEVGDFVAASHELSCASGEGWIGRVWATGTPSWIADVANDASFRRALPATRAGLHGAFSFQVPVRGATWGVAEFFSTKIERPDEALLATLATIGVQIGEFIARRQAQEALLGAEERYRLALEGADLGTWDLHVPSGASTLNDNYFEMHGYAPGEIDTGFDTWQRLLHPDDAARVVEQFGAHLRGENEAFESEYRMHLKSGGWGWFLDRGRVIERDVEGRPVRVCGTHLDITLRKVAEKALLEEKRLLEEARRRELQTGHEIQRSLLIGETPSGIPGADIAGYAVPSRGIDGDFYAFTRFRPDCFELLVGDVMGKGVPAALVGAAIHTAYHQVVAELTATSLGGGELPRPADIVNALHARLTPRLIELETFATLALYRFDLARGELTYVNAGHTPGLLLRGAGDINRILGANVPVGTLEDERYVEAMQPISPGDALLVYSDGITEARNIADAEFGEERLRSFLLSLLRARAVPARIALQALRKRVHDYAGERALADDETAVMIGLFGRPDTVETAFSPAGDGETFDLPWDFAGFEPLRRRVAAAASRLGPDAADRLVLASFEAATNVVRHVARPFPDATLCCRLRPGRDELTVELWYVGLPFEPEPEHVPDLSGESEGGFGLHIIDHAVSRVSYEQPVLDVCCTRLVQSVAEQAAA